MQCLVLNSGVVLAVAAVHVFSVTSDGVSSAVVASTQICARLSEPARSTLAMHSGFY